MFSLSCSSFFGNRPNFSNIASLKILQESIIQQQRQKEILETNVAAYYANKLDPSKPELILQKETSFKQEPIIKTKYQDDYEQTLSHDMDKNKNCSQLQQDEIKSDNIEKKENTVQPEQISTDNFDTSYLQQETVVTANINSSLDRISTNFSGADNMTDSQGTSSRPTKLKQAIQDTKQITQPSQTIMFDNISLQKYTEFSKQFHVSNEHMITDRQQCVLDNMWHLQTLPHAASSKLRVLHALRICFKEQNIEHIQNTQYIQYLQSERILLNQQIQSLKKKNVKLTQQLEKKDIQPTALHRDFDSFRVRMLDIPWNQMMAPVIDRFPDFEEMISQKVCSQFPIILLELQQKLLNKAYEYTIYPRVEILERTDPDGVGTGLLLLQIKYPAPGISDDDIIQFYHHGMLDYIEFPRNNKADELIKRFGEKVALILEKMATRNSFLTISCKIIASLPDASTVTYRPSRKRIFIHYNNTYPSYHLKATCTTHGFSHTKFPWLKQPPMCSPPGFTPHSPDSGTLPFPDIIQKNQQTPDLPDHLHWDNYKLLAEGHYLQIYSTANCSSFLPFSGEGDLLELKHIKNIDDMDEDDDQGSPQSIDSTHRDI